MFEGLGYDPDDKITLITFDNIAEKYNLNVSQLIGLNISARGRTYMLPDTINVCKYNAK